METTNTFVKMFIDQRANLDFLDSAVLSVNNINAIAGKMSLPHIDINVDSDLKTAMVELNLKQIPIVVSEIDEAIASLLAGNVSPCDSSGFRDDIQDILFTAAGGLGFLTINDFEYRFATEATFDLALTKGREDADSVITALLIIKYALNASATYLADCPGRNSLDHLRSTYITLFILAVELGRLYEYDITTDWDEVCRSNYSKFDAEFEDIGKSCAKYFDKGIIVQPRLSPCGQYYAYIVPYDQCVDGKHYPEGKFLKSHMFKEPNYNRSKPSAISTTSVG